MLSFCDKLCFVYIVFACVLHLVNVVQTQLLINVRNQGGDVLQETISSNVTEDTVTLEFQRSDGTLVTQLIDFRNEVQILKSVILGEEERGQSQYQVVCFVCHFQNGDFISSDAMAKLRQKNPSTIRTPEEDRGVDNYTMDYFVNLENSGVISKHVANMCAEARDATYTRHQDIQLWSKTSASAEETYMSAVHRFPVASKVGASGYLGLSQSEKVGGSCKDAGVTWKPCRCHLEVCIGWYPCGLKYCKGKGENKNSLKTYRCGIKTCKKCNFFSYVVQQKQQCLWDE